MKTSTRLSARLGLAALCGVLFFSIYGGVNAYTATLPRVVSLYAPWEQQIPFVAWMILPYMSLDVFFVGAFLLCRQPRALSLLVQRISLMILLSAAGFLLMPLRFGFARPQTSGLSGVLFEWLSLDLPFNQCPSLHISLGLLIGTLYWQHTRNYLRGLVALWFALILTSPVLVYQHHLVDILGGAVAWLCCLLLIPGDLPMHRRVALRYLGLGVILASLAMGLGGFAWLLLLALPGVLLYCLAYACQRPDWLSSDRSGPVAWMLLPMRLALWLNWHLWSRLDPTTMVEIEPGLWLGRRLSAREATELPARGIGAVLDLASELPATPLPSGVQRQRIALLDLVPLTPAALDQARTFIAAQRQYAGVYVHCALGYGRAAQAVASYLAGDGPLGPQLTHLARYRRVVVTDCVDY